MGFLQTVDGSFLQTASVQTGIAGSWILTSDANIIDILTPTATGSVGTAYSSNVNSGEGTGPYDFSVIDGALPTSLTIHALTGIIDGTPTVTGTFTFSILVTDALLGTNIKTFSISITSAPAPGSGIYKIVPEQTYDELYTTIPSTTQVKIPNQFVESYLLGDE